MNATTRRLLFEQNLEWAAAIARNVHRRLPPSFELDDLAQEARLRLWRCAQEFEPASGVPFQAFAYRTIRGAVLMKVRRRHWTDHTMHELIVVDQEEPGDTRAAVPLLTVEHIDPVAQLEAEALADARRNADPRHVWLLDELDRLEALDAYLVRRVYIDGIPEEDVARSWGIGPEELTRRLGAAVRKLKKAKRRSEPAAAGGRK